MVGSFWKMGDQCRNLEAQEMTPKTILILGLFAVLLSFFAGIMVIYPKLLQARREASDNNAAKELADLRRKNAQDSIVMYEERFRIHLEHDTMYNDSIQRKMDDIIAIKRIVRYIPESNSRTFYDSVWAKIWNYKPR